MKKNIQNNCLHLQVTPQKVAPSYFFFSPPLSLSPFPSSFLSFCPVFFHHIASVHVTHSELYDVSAHIRTHTARARIHASHTRSSCAWRARKAWRHAVRVLLFAVLFSRPVRDKEEDEDEERKRVQPHPTDPRHPRFTSFLSAPPRILLSRDPLFPLLPLPTTLLSS